MLRVDPQESPSAIDQEQSKATKRFRRQQIKLVWNNTDTEKYRTRWDLLKTNNFVILR